ncbi:MAG: hypothetical protein EOO61_05125 [Hymenobacter sp.]|nr:MAG: hypothetical protein EOO61_05125 [Hymenobacter sp.]
MKFFKKMKDGGAESTVTGYWLIEWKKAFSIALIKFQGKSREAYHSHAFNCINWLLAGKLVEDRMWHHTISKINHSFVTYLPSLKPFFIFREDFHKVDSHGTSWVLSIRGPWADKWHEWRPNEDRYVTLTHGRKEVC